MSSTIFELLHRVAHDIPGCLHTSVVDIESGMSLAAISPGQDNLGAAGADAYQSDLFRQIRQASEGLQSKRLPESVVIIGEMSIFISSPFPQTTYFWHVVTSIDTTIGFTQAIMRKYQQPLIDSISNVFH